MLLALPGLAAPGFPPAAAQALHRAAEGAWAHWTPAERAARRASENALPRHFKSFVVATGVVLVGVGLVRTNAGERKQTRSKLVRHALGLPERRTRGSED